VEHPCQRCGANVEDSSPFCPSCDLPQVRFAGSASSAQKVIVATPVELADFSAEAKLAELAPDPVVRVNNRIAWRSALLAGVIAALVSFLPLGLILGAPLGGFLSIVLYRRRTLTGDSQPGFGFRLGTLSGLFGYLIFAAFLGSQILLTRGQNEMRDGMIEAVHRQQMRNPDPQTRQMLDYFLTPHGLAIMMIGGLLFVAIVFVLLSGLGGAVSAALLKRKQPPE